MAHLITLYIIPDSSEPPGKPETNKTWLICCNQETTGGKRAKQLLWERNGNTHNTYLKEYIIFLRIKIYTKDISTLFESSRYVWWPRQYLQTNHWSDWAQIWRLNLLWDPLGLINFSSCSADILPFSACCCAEQFLCICRQTNHWFDWHQIWWWTNDRTSAAW